jgi:prepilin signal peptidase PulO-like enzyme (type II secretory pathway)
MSRERADRVAAWATGAGVGFAALMLTWLVANRLTALLWDPPLGPSVAFVAAIVVGVVTALVSGRRLARRVANQAQETGR